MTRKLLEFGQFEELHLLNGLQILGILLSLALDSKVRVVVFDVTFRMSRSG